jgi:hypothetical protein
MLHCGSFALMSLEVSSAPLQAVLHQMPWICTTVQQGCGRQLSSAWHAINLQLHRLETSWCLREVKPYHQVSCVQRKKGVVHRCLFGQYLRVVHLRVPVYHLDRLLSQARLCRFHRCRGFVQQCNRGMVNGSAQRGALLSCSCIGRELGHVRGGCQKRCVAVCRGC